MTDLERRALLGDCEAQEVCTARGIALPCPFCGSKKIILSNWGMWRCWCSDCKSNAGDTLSEIDAIKSWNTRVAPPLGRCGTCKYRTTDTQWTRSGFCGRRGAGDFFVAKPDGFCSYYEPKEETCNV